MVRQLIRVASTPEPVALEERYLLPVWMSDIQARLIRQDLRKWMLKFRCSAMMKGPEVVANYGDEHQLDWCKVEAAQAELLQVMNYHTGAKQPFDGRVTKVIMELKQQLQGKEPEIFGGEGNDSGTGNEVR